MKVTVEFTAQIRRAAGVSVEDYSVEDGCTADALLRQIAGGTAASWVASS